MAVETESLQTATAIEHEIEQKIEQKMIAIEPTVTKSAVTQVRECEMTVLATTPLWYLV